MRGVHEPAFASERLSQAETLVRTHALAGLGTGLIPIPLMDVVAGVGVQVKLVQALASLYGVPFQQQELVHSLVAGAVAGLGVPSAMTPLLASALKFVPGLGTLAGSVSLPVMMGASTYALGKVFILHFEAGGTLLDFDARALQSQLRQLYQEGLDEVRRMQAQRPSEGKEKTRPAPPVSSSVSPASVSPTPPASASTASDRRLP